MSRTGDGFKRNKKGKETEISVSSLEVDPERLFTMIPPDHKSKCKSHFAKQNAFCFFFRF